MFSASQAAWAGMSERMGQSAMGRALKIGAAESFGVWYEGSIFATEGLKSHGFLGIRGGARTLGQNWSAAAARGGMKGAMGRVGALGKFAGGTAFKALPLLGTAYFAYTGYQESGVAGAAMGIGESVLWSAAPRILGAAIGGTAAGIATGVVAGVGAVYGGAYVLGTLAKAHAKKLRDVEFGGGQIVDAIGSAGAATMRQRSLSALQNTHLNGRMAMGNEALLMHTPFR